MKAKLLITVFLLLAGMAFADALSELDSLRRLVLAPKVEKYQNSVDSIVELIKITNEKTKLKSYAKQVVDLSNDLMSEIKLIYGYRVMQVRKPVYLGNNCESNFHPAVGKFIFPVTTVRVGSLPDYFEELEYIKDYAWRIRMFTKTEVIKRNVEGIRNRNSHLNI